MFLYKVIYYRIVNLFDIYFGLILDWFNCDGWWVLDKVNKYYFYVDKFLNEINMESG